MGLLDFILNLAGLLLWVNWRTEPLNPQTLVSTRNLLGTLRRADLPMGGRWRFLVGLVLLLVVRAFAYRIIGPEASWPATLDLGAVSISFRSDHLTRMLWYSFLSFGVILVGFHMAMLFLSLLRNSTADSDAASRLTRTHLGALDTWPRGVRLVAPLAVVAVIWFAATWPLGYWDIIPKPVSVAHRFQQSILLGLGSYLIWKYFVAGFLALHMINSYVYFGKHHVWKYVDRIANKLLRPLKRLPLRLAKVDFRPLVGMVAVLLLAFLLENGLATPKRVDARGRAYPPLIDVPGLVDFFRRVNP